MYEMMYTMPGEITPTM